MFSDVTIESSFFVYQGTEMFQREYVIVENVITTEMPLCRGTVVPYLDCTHCYYCGLIRPPSAELPPFCCLLIKPNEEVESPDCFAL